MSSLARSPCALSITGTSRIALSVCDLATVHHSTKVSLQRRCIMARTLFLRVILAVVLTVGAIGCGTDRAVSPVAPSPAKNNTVPSPNSTVSAVQGAGALSILPPTEQLTLIGGLSLDGYCQSLGYANSTLTKPQIGPNAAFNNWRCQAADGATHPFSMTKACQWQYGANAIQAHPTDTEDAFTWVCYRTPGG
jgi:hypothetical protein